MSEQKIKWEDNGSWRDTRCEIGDYLLLASGMEKYQFGWAVFHKNVELAASEKGKRCRSIVEAQRIAEAVYRTATKLLP